MKSASRRSDADVDAKCRVRGITSIDELLNAGRLMPGKPVSQRPFDLSGARTGTSAASVERPNVSAAVATLLFAEAAVNLPH